MRLSPEQATWVDRVGTFILANIMWVLLAVLVLPMPAATAGLFNALTPVARDRSTALFRDFFSGMRQYWWKSTLIVLADIVLGGLVVLNFRIIGQPGFPQVLSWAVGSVTLFVGLALALTNMYLWALLVQFDLSFRALWRTAFQMALAHPWWSLLVLALAVMPPLLATTLPAFFTLLFTFSSTALVVLLGTWRVIGRYVTEDFVTPD